MTEEEVLSHATPDVDLKPEVSSLSSDSEQNWDEDKPVKIHTIEHSNKGSKLSEQSNVPGNSSELLFLRLIKIKIYKGKRAFALPFRYNGMIRHSLATLEGE